MVHVWLGQWNRLGMSVDVKASQCDSTVHVWRLSHLNEEVDDCNVIRWCHLLFCLHKWGGRYKRNCAQTRGFIHSLVPHSLVCYPVGSSRKPQTLSLSYLGASWGVGLLPYRKVFFICSSICVQGYLRHYELVCFSCLWVSWVTSHPASIKPGIGEARTTTLWSGVVHMG